MGRLRLMAGVLSPQFYNFAFGNSKRELTKVGYLVSLISGGLRCRVVSGLRQVGFIGLNRELN